MKNKLIVANLKKSMSLEDVSVYLKSINQIYNSNLVICPPSIYIPYFLKHGYEVGLQNIYYENNCTGEITSRQAYDCGIRYAIVGHSDRRIGLYETDEEVNRKIKSAIQSGLRVIFCIGETKEERDMLRTDRILKKQLEIGLKDIDDLHQICIVYEPVWAIGTSVSANLRDIQKTAIFIKEWIQHQKNYEDIPVLYGGSVNQQNIVSILKLEEIDGVMVGKSAVDGSVFLKLLEVAHV